MLTKNRNDVLSLLLTGARIIDQNTLEEGYASSARLSTPLQKVLVMQGIVSQYKMDRVLHAESLIRAKSMSPETAVKALRLAVTQQLSFDDAYAALGDEHKKTQNLPSASNQIVNLLQEAGLLTNEQIGRALNTSLETGMQMGRVLVFHRDISSQILKAALTCAALLQDEKIGTRSAIEALQTVKKANQPIEQVLFELDILREETGQGPRLIDLFTMAGFASESDMMECLEIHVLRGRQMGSIFIEQGLISQEILENTIILQGMVTSNVIKSFHAAEALKKAHAKQISIYQALGELEPPAVPLVASLSYGELLVSAGIITRETLADLSQSDESEGPTALQIAKRALVAGHVSERACMTSLRCHSLNTEGFLSNKASVDILNRCVTNDASLDEQLAAAGHFVPNRMQWIWH